jgi:anti-sigma regulatory factor (Ser/Thr protein kinase)
MTKAVKLHYEIHGKDFNQAGEVAAQIKRYLKKRGLPIAIVRRVAIATYEGEINMVIHADGGTVDVIITERQITLILTDTGEGISEPQLAMKEGYSTATEHVRSLGFGAGMGLPNMRKNTDHLEIESRPGKGTTVRMKILLDAAKEKHTKEK